MAGIINEISVSGVDAELRVQPEAQDGRCDRLQEEIGPHASETMSLACMILATQYPVT